MELPSLSRFIILRYIKIHGIWRAFAICPCRRSNHRSRSLDQIDCCLHLSIGSEWILLGFLFVPLQDFPHWGWLQGYQPSRACDTSKAIQQADAERTLWDQAYLAIFVGETRSAGETNPPSTLLVLLKWFQMSRHIIPSLWGSLYFTDISESFLPGWNTSRTLGMLGILKKCLPNRLPYDSVWLFFFLQVQSVLIRIMLAWAAWNIMECSKCWCSQQPGSIHGKTMGPF